MIISVPIQYSRSFCIWLIQQIQECLMYTFNNQKVAVIETYINQHYKSPYINHISVYQVLMFAVNNLVINTYGNYFTISINSNVKYGLTNFKIIELCNLIQYGILGLTGYPILVYIFNFISSNLDKQYQKYLQETM